MSVRKRKWTTRKGEAKEAWVVDYVDKDGDRHIETFRRKKDADEYEATVKVDVRAGIHTAASKSITVAQAATDWINVIEGVRAREPSTVDQYRQHARHINDLIGSKKLSSLTAPGIHTFLDDLLATMSRAMARKVLRSLKSVLSIAQERGNVAQNVALNVKIGVNKRDQRKLEVGVDIPTPDEIKTHPRQGIRPIARAANDGGLNWATGVGATRLALGRRRPKERQAECPPAC